MRLGTVTPVLDMHAAIRICMVENRVFQKSQRRTSGFLASITGKKDKTSAADLIHGILVSESSEFIALSCREVRKIARVYMCPPLTHCRTCLFFNGRKVRLLSISYHR